MSGHFGLPKFSSILHVGRSTGHYDPSSDDAFSHGNYPSGTSGHGLRGPCKNRSKGISDFIITSVRVLESVISPPTRTLDHHSIVNHKSELKKIHDFFDLDPFVSSPLDSNPSSLSSKVSSFFSSQIGGESSFNLHERLSEDSFGETSLSLIPKTESEERQEFLDKIGDIVPEPASHHKKDKKHHDKHKKSPPPPPPPKEHSYEEIATKKQEIAETEKIIEEKRLATEKELLIAGAAIVAAGGAAGPVGAGGAAAGTLGLATYDAASIFASELELTKLNADLDRMLKENETFRSQQSEPPPSSEHDPYETSASGGSDNQYIGYVDTSPQTQDIPGYDRENIC